eukprot:TRINITY_DN1529_c0_g1_i1.p1 TRINITY_DN1529_c0_g1~~TRINITY_DN1529_c0_g1_i1.p1  ORF type:complete len:390 (+),score=63.34 TRINITY_DN1529_c0_g1_i1:82-1251(+)
MNASLEGEGEKQVNIPITYKKTLLLTSSSNPFKVSNKILTYPPIFNPSVLHLPNQQYLMMARLPKVKKIEIENKTFVVSQLLAGIAKIHKDIKEMNYVGKTTEVEYSRGISGRMATGCFVGVVGIEDPRLIWSPEGSPLLIFGTESTDAWVCRSCWVVDARYFLSLDDKLGDKPPPKLFPEPVELLRYEEPSKIEKNWSAFYAPDHLGLHSHRLYFHAQLKAPRVWFLNDTSGKMHPVTLGDNSLYENCIKRHMEGGSLRIHHATPLLSVVLCKRGECEPDNTNTILIAIVHDQHKKKGMNWYRPYAITWHRNYPFQFRSISPRLFFAGLGATLTYTTSMNWKRNEGVKDLSFGYLDDIVMVTIGLEDQEAFYLDFPMQDMLQDHHMCA